MSALEESDPIVSLDNVRVDFGGTEGTDSNTPLLIDDVLAHYSVSHVSQGGNERLQSRAVRAHLFLVEQRKKLVEDLAWVFFEYALAVRRPKLDENGLSTTGWPLKAPLAAQRMVGGQTLVLAADANELSTAVGHLWLGLDQHAQGDEGPAQLEQEITERYEIVRCFSKTVAINEAVKEGLDEREMSSRKIRTPWEIAAVSPYMRWHKTN